MTSPHVLARSAPRRPPIAFATLAALLFIVPAASGCSKNSSSEAPASASDPVIARVNGVDITQGDLALAEEDMGADMPATSPEAKRENRSEEHTSELQSLTNLVCRLLLEKKKKKKKKKINNRREVIDTHNVEIRQ